MELARFAVGVPFPLVQWPGINRGLLFNAAGKRR